MKQILLYCIVVILLGCNYRFSTSQTQKKEEVVLIFKDAPIQTKEEQYGMRTEDPNGCIHYIDSTYTLCTFLPKNTGYDTLIIPTFNGYANLAHTYQVFESIRYYFTAGDTILFTYNQTGRPYAQSRINNQLTRYYNLQESIPGYLFETNGYSNMGVLRNIFLINVFAYFKTDAAKQFPTLKTKYEKAYINLDSIETLYHNHIRKLHDSLAVLLKQHVINKAQYRYSLGDSQYNDSLVRFWRTSK